MIISVVVDRAIAWSWFMERSEFDYAGGAMIETGSRVTDEAQYHAQQELEGRMGETDSEADGVYNWMWPLECSSLF